MNYAIKSNCNQYQYIIEVVFICKAFKNAAASLVDKEPAKQISFVDIN